MYFYELKSIQIMIKKILAIALLITTYTSQAQYKLEFKIDNQPDTTVQLLRYLGDKFFYVDTAELVDGRAVFEKEEYDGGVYAFYTGAGYFEFIMADKNVSIETDAKDFIGKMNVKKSDENKIFYQYIRFINDKRKEAESIRGEIDKLKAAEPVAQNKIDILELKVKGIDTEVKSFQKQLVADNQDKLIGKILKMSVDIEIPDIADSLKGSYLRDHFWDNVDLTDSRLARTPVFKQKTEMYFKKMMHQIPDTILRHASIMVDQIEDSTDMMKYVLNYIHVTYETSNIMGMDAVFVGMSEKYYCAPAENKAWWYPEENLKNRCERAPKLKPLLIGAQAPNLRLADTTEKKWVALSDVKAEYKAIIFWDPDCGHCKKELPKLQVLYKELKDKKIDVEFIAIGTNLENEKWKKMVHDQNLDWINLSDFPEANKNAGKYIYEMQVTDLLSLDFRKTYDIFSTPQIYLLDKDGTIVGKRLDANNLARMIERYMDVTIDYKEEKKEEEEDEDTEEPQDH
ncbi:MAG: peroxiredoxin [Parvicella sp.]|jgi:peroxiredoxin